MLAASVRGPSNQVLSEVLRAGRASTARLSPLSTPDSILMCYQYRSKEMGHSPPPGVLSWEWHRRRSTQRGVKPRTGDKEKVVFYACT
jgi:hypothetical protein